MCRLERWSTRQLNDRIRSMLYERTAISKKPETTIASDLQALRHEGRVSADLAFRDPYVLDFLGLADTYSEHDLESAILAELQRFISELGTDFAFVARQKRRNYCSRSCMSRSNGRDENSCRDRRTPMSSEIGKPERETQRRVIALLSDELGYRYVGDSTDPEQYGKTGNSNIEEKLLTSRIRLVAAESSTEVEPERRSNHRIQAKLARRVSEMDLRVRQCRWWRAGNRPQRPRRSARFGQSQQTAGRPAEQDSRRAGNCTGGRLG
jgi:hypothetical protein